MRRARVYLIWMCCVGTMSGCEQNQPDSLPTGPAMELPAGAIPPAELEFQTLIGNAGENLRVIGEEEHALLLVELKPENNQPQIISSPEVGISPLKAMQDRKLDLVIGSGFVTQPGSLTPVGLLQDNGKILTPLQNHGYTRIIGITDAGLGVVHRRAFDPSMFRSALQAGPGIIEQGELDISERDLQRPRYFRSFVASCKDRWIVGISLAPTHLRTLGQTLLSDMAANGYQCRDVVNLAGDRQAVMLLRLPSGQILFHGDVHALKVSLLGFR